MRSNFLRAVSVFCVFCCFFLTNYLSAADLKAIEAGSYEEWGLARRVIMHTPGNELQLGIYHPDAALFERVFSIDKASLEHKNYISLLEKNGAKVHTVVETLLQGTLDENGNPKESKELDELRKFARQFITVDATSISAEEQKNQEKYLDGVMKQLDPKELVSIILNQPVIKLAKTEINTGYSATYEMKPVMNLYFCRDQMITTDRGVVINKMNSPQREFETRIMKFVLIKLGITPIYEVTGDGRLEGGDFLVAGENVLIGQGVRTNEEGIRQLLENDVFGKKRVIVVKDSWKNQVQMHLDTYFNIINKNLAVCVDTRLRNGENQPSEKMLVKVDVYEFVGEKYVQKVKNADFQDYIEKELKMKIIPVTNDDQLKYGINFLTIAPNKILGIDGVSSEYKTTLKNAGVDAIWMDFSNLTGGYGAAHCATQVVQREKSQIQANVEVYSDSNVQKRWTEIAMQVKKATSDLADKKVTEGLDKLMSLNAEMALISDKYPLYKSSVKELQRMVNELSDSLKQPDSEKSGETLKNFVSLLESISSGKIHDEKLCQLLKKAHSSFSNLAGLIGQQGSDVEKTQSEILTIQREMESAAKQSPVYASVIEEISKSASNIRFSVLQGDYKQAGERTESVLKLLKSIVE
ncbi:MAG: hypothetical protein HQM10_23975 [Candidatus Riflebacteria bacterium]|nr:hypothetical protein [Candidatus Riflebacteria bacterium]